MTTLFRIVTAAFCLFVSLPILWLLYAAFLPPEAVVTAQLLPSGFSLDNFALLPESGVWRALGVSVSATSLVIVAQLVTGLLAAYAIRAGFKVVGLALVFIALPSELLLVPLYRLLQQLGLLDNFGALVVPFLASPFVIFLVLQSMRRIPWELVEAARLDGAGEGTIVARVIAPLLRPELVATGVLAFAAHWNLVLYPKVMVSSDRLWTVQVFLTELLRARPFEWGLLGASALITTLPLLILYLVFERRIIAVFEGGFR